MAKKTPTGATPSTERVRADYFNLTRGPWYGFLFALPVLTAYEVLVALYGRRIINGADSILTRFTAPLMELLGTGRAPFLLAVLLIGGYACWAAHRATFGAAAEAKVRRSYFIGMFLESAIYAVFFGLVVNYLLRLVLPGFMLQIGGGGLAGGPIFQLAMALGAGLYEELFFRVIVMGGFALLLIKAFKTPVVGAWILAALASSFVFSAFHYIGSLGDAFSVTTFVYRFVAGLLLAAIYGLRGFGIAVWTHALYDVLVFLQGH